MKKNIVVIGGTSGIGNELVRILDQDHHVFVFSRTNKNLEGLQASYTVEDVQSEQDPNIAHLPEQIDGLIYCPGTINLRPVQNLKKQSLLKDLEVNFFGIHRWVQALLPRLKKSEQSSIVLFSTVAVKVGMPYHTSIAAAKGAVEAYGKSLAAELAPKVRVNIIAPSLTHTPLADKYLNNDEKLQKSAARHPLHAVGSPKEIAELAAFLALEKSSWMSGQIIQVDGGLSTLKTDM